MKTQRHLYSALTLIVFGLLFCASASVKQISTTEKTYADTKKKSGTITVSYNLPVITPTADTKQTQTKGTVTVSCEIIPITVAMKDNVERKIADSDQPGYDVYEVSHVPSPVITPDRFKLNIKIKNNGDRILKVRETALLLQVDGVQYHIPEASLTDWYGGMIIKNGEFNYTINGPDFTNLANAKLIYLFINDVPTIMDEGGNIKKRENFEWYFECKQEQQSKQVETTYTYETSPIRKERCNSCSGAGSFSNTVTCSACSGRGIVYNSYSKANVKCYSCSGNGKVIQKTTCSNCSGAGELSYPLSKRPPVTSSVTYSGAVVEVVTIPTGAQVSVVNTKTGEYQYSGTANRTVNWYQTNQKQFPIIVEYNGKEVKVLPYNDKGKLIPKVVVNFTTGGTVEKGKRAY
jgi:hypothetical protein